MVEKLSIEKGLASKIYGLAYNEPVSGYQLAKEIGTQPHHVNDKIKQLHKDGYLIKISNNNWRWPKWRANVRPLVKKIVNIKKDKKINLTKLDQEVLYDRLSSKYFRQLICNNIKYQLREENTIDSVEEILSGFEMFTLFMEQNRDYVQKCLKITNRKQYKKEILEARKRVDDLLLRINVKIFSDNISDEDIIKIYNVFKKENMMTISLEEFKSRIQQVRDSKQLSFVKPKTLKDIKKRLGSTKNFYDLFINSFITPMPKNLLINYRGISSFGRKYLDIEKRIEEIWKFRTLNILYDIEDDMSKTKK